MKPELNGTEFWNAVHEAIQARLTRLDALLQTEVSGLRVMGGRSSGKAFPLFSYRSYAVNDLEPVVVGITFHADRAQFRAKGDVCGESSGEVLHEIPAVIASSNPTEIVQAAQRIADDLAAALEPVREALLNPSRTA